MTLRPLTDTDATLPQGTALVIFSAPWCGPCKTTKLSMQKLDVPAFEVNGEENPGLMGQYHVQTFPTLLLVRNGQVRDTLYGGRTEQQLRDWLARTA